MNCLYIDGLREGNVLGVPRRLRSTAGCCSRSRGWREGAATRGSDAKVRWAMLASGDQRRQMRWGWASGRRQPGRTQGEQELVTHTERPPWQEQNSGPRLYFNSKFPSFYRVSVKLYHSILHLILKPRAIKLHHKGPGPQNI